MNKDCDRCGEEFPFSGDKRPAPWSLGRYKGHVLCWLCYEDILNAEKKGRLIEDEIEGSAEFKERVKKS